MRRSIAVTVISGLALSGCAILTPPREKPLLTESFTTTESTKGSFVLAATDANRRVAIVNLLSGQVCVEPPPEAANTISEALAAIFEANIQDKGKLAANISQTVSQSISQLYKRTQTVQLYRDAVFALCQGANNGSILISVNTKAPIEANISNSIKNYLGTNVDRAVAVDLEANLISLQTVNEIDKKIDALKSGTAQSEVDARSYLRSIKKNLQSNLQKAEFSGRLEDGLKKAFASLEKELPLFYQTEKIRFMVELGKPMQVCRTEYAQEKDPEGRQLIKQQVCDVKIPENIEKVIKEYVQALPKEDKPK